MPVGLTIAHTSAGRRERTSYDVRREIMSNLGGAKNENMVATLSPSTEPWYYYPRIVPSKLYDSKTFCSTIFTRISSDFERCQFGFALLICPDRRWTMTSCTSTGESETVPSLRSYCLELATTSQAERPVLLSTITFLIVSVRVPRIANASARVNKLTNCSTQGNIRTN
jgi:hypothetical protein